MRKIYRVRHMEQMLLLVKRIRRNSITESQKRKADMLVENYQKLLEFVQDS